MAFDTKEQEIVKWGLENGKNRLEVEQAISRYRAARLRDGAASREREQNGFGEAVKEAARDVYEGYQGVGEELYKAGEKIEQTSRDENLTVGQRIRTNLSEMFRGGARAFGQAFMTIPKLLVGQETEEAVSRAAGDVARKVGESEPVQKLLADYNALPEDARREVDNALGFAEGLAEILTGGTASRVARPAIRAAIDAAKVGAGAVGDAAGAVRSLFTRTPRSVDDVITQADTALAREGTPAQMRASAEATKAPTSLTEMWVGISPDIKKRIAGKQDKLREYFDIAHARNADDTLPTPYEYGAQQAQNAVEQMEGLLAESGGKIGQTRQKLGTYQAAPDDIAAIESSFTNELGKLNLEIRRGVVRQKPGTVTKVSGGDVNVLNELYENLQVVKGSPTLTNIIEFRSSLDSRINFGKRANEVSGEVDPLSRQVRKTAADTAAKIVGTSEAAEVKRFSDFMDAYNDLKSYTDRRAGGEYLLRLVLSGRGGEARQIIQTIKEYTGIDLMDDATMMTLATDFIGNTRQKGLFRQEMTKAGLEVAALLRGDPTGLISTALRVGQDVAAEKILLDAAKSSQ